MMVTASEMLASRCIRDRARRAAIVRAAARGSSACKIFADGIDHRDEA